MTVRPSRGMLLAVALAVVLHSLARASGGQWLVVEAGIAAGVVVTSLLLRPRLEALEVRLLSPPRAVVGEVVTQRLIVRNPTRRPMPATRWASAVAGLEAVTLDVPALAPGQEVQLPVRRAALRRGEWVPGGAVLTTAPWGALVVARPVPAELVLVVPALGTPVFDPQRVGSTVGQDTAPAGVAGHGLEVLGLRPWRPGDPARDVSARASARHGRPFVLEREREQAPGAPLVVVATGGSEGEAWERSVADAAATAAQAVAQRRRVTLSTRHRSWEPRTEADVLEFFARVDTAPDVPLDELLPLLNLVHPGGQAIHLQGGAATAGVEQVGTCCQVAVLRG